MKGNNSLAAVVLAAIVVAGAFATVAPAPAEAATAGNVSIQQQPFTTTSDERNTTRDVTIVADRNLTFDNGNNYHLVLTNDDTGDSVTLAANATFNLTADPDGRNDRLAFLVYEADGTPNPEGHLWYQAQNHSNSKLYDFDVVSGSIPQASGTTNFSVTLVNATTSNAIASTASRPSVVGHSGLLTQNSTDGDVRLSIPRSGALKGSNVSVELYERDNRNNSTTIPMQYDAGADAFTTTITASEFPASQYSWEVKFSYNNWQILQVRSPRSANEYIELGNVTVSGNVTLADRTDAPGHTVLFSSENGPDNATVTDTNGDFRTSLPPGVDYEIGVVQADVSKNSWTLPKDDTVDFWPLGERNFTSDATNGTIRLPVGHTLNVTVVDADTGDPIENASVRVFKSNNGARFGIDGNTTAAGVFDPPAEGTGLEVNGTVDLEVVGPQGTAYGNNSTTVNVTGDRNVTVELSRPTSISGQVEYNNGTTVASDELVTTLGPRFRLGYTDTTGSYSVGDLTAGNYSLTYYQLDRTDFEFKNHDGNPDIYYLGEVDASGPTDVGTATLPSAYVVNVTVVDADGNAVENAGVRLRALGPDGEQGSGYDWANATDASGLFQMPGKEKPGIELAGRYTVEAVGPMNSTAFATEITSRNVSISGERELTLTVNRTDVAPDSHDFGTVATDSTDTVDVTVTNDGDFNFTASGTSIVGTNDRQFTVVAGGGTFTLEPGESHTVTVEFAPTSAGSMSAALRFDNPEPANGPALKVPLSGEGSTASTATPTPTPTSTPTPTPSPTPAPTTPTPTDTPEPTPTPTATPTDSPAPTATDTPTDTPATGVPTTGASPTATTTGAPGFGAAVAVLALAGAVVLLRRRRD